MTWPQDGNRLFPAPGHDLYPTYKAWRRLKRLSEFTWAYWFTRGTTGFARFLEDLGHCPSRRHFLVRLDPSKGYWPGNVEWRLEQRDRPPRRLLDHNGKKLGLAEHCRLAGLKFHTVAMRLKRGESLAEALSRPVRIPS